VTPLDRFWQSLEEIPGPAGVAAVWKAKLGAEYELAQRFLRPRNELAVAFPNPDPYGGAYRVVTHGPDDHVGVCDETGETIQLTTADLIVHELDRPRLEQSIAGALRIRYRPAALEQARGTGRLGFYEPLAGYRFPVYLAVRSRGDDFRQVVAMLASAQTCPFLLFAPTHRFMNPAIEQIVERQRGCFMALCDAMAADDPGKLVTTPVGEKALQRFRESFLPTQAVAQPATFFPTPAGVAWENVRLEFLDGHTLSVRLGGQHGVYHFTQMGMVNRKNGSPTVQWELLRDFAAGHGILTWRSAAADRKNQKRREKLARDLQAFFRIAGDPFIRHGDGWQTRFQIEPDR